MIKNRVTIKKTKTNIGDPKELFDIEAYQSPSAKTFGYIATCVRTGRGWNEEFRGKYAEQEFEKAMDKMSVPMEIEWDISTEEVSETVEATCKGSAMSHFYAIYPELDCFDMEVQKGGYVFED